MVSAPKKVTAQQVAEYFIYKANKEGVTITNKKLQKLVYYAQAWSLALNDKKLFSERIEAWVHGPAIKSLYVKYKEFGFGPINKTAESTSVELILGDTKKLLDQVWGVYGVFDASYLEMLTHSEKPWREAREGLESHKNSENEISIGSMKAYYTEKLKAARKKK